MLVDAQNTELGQRVGVRGQPGGARSLEPGVEHMFVAAFDEPAADGQFAGDGSGVVERVAPVAEVAPGGTHGGRFRGHRVGLEMRFQLGEHGLDGSVLEPLLLGVRVL